MLLPTIETRRLRLRPFVAADAPAVQVYVGEWDVASTTAAIPHPYEPGMAEAWIASHSAEAAEGQGLTLAIDDRAENRLVGSIALRLAAEHARGELGYWIGKPHWRRGYVTEAAAAVMAYGFDTLELNRIEAHHLAGNTASGRVLQKLGMTREGCMRDHVRKWESFHDVEGYSILRREYQPQRGT
ncbi:MAG: GNAT family N-acetyltransferase [Gemmatimonadales bacterium]|nr:GNAT family N-acetyltransferase [Gemmatimonadales bacterium]